jgi:hypothetical protein
MLVATESFVASGIVALAHGSAYNIDGTIWLGTRDLSSGANLGALQLGGLSLYLMYHHLSLSPETTRRRRSV